MSWNLFEKILSVFNPQNDTDQPSEPSEQWPESTTEKSWQEGSSEPSQTETEPEASQEPSPSVQQTSCSIDDSEQPDDCEQPENKKDWQQE